MTPSSKRIPVENPSNRHVNKTLIALWTLLLTAIAAIAVLAVMWNAQRQHDARRRATSLLAEQLQPFNRDIARLLGDYELQFQRLVPQVEPRNAAQMSLVKRNPTVQHIVVVDTAGQLLYPDSDHIAPQDRSLISDAQLLLADQAFLPAGNEQSAAAGNRSRTEFATNGPVNFFQSNKRSINSSSSGWTTWYHQRGIVLGYWWRQESIGTSMIIVPRARWVADLIAELPSQAELDQAGPTPIGFCQLVDVEGDVIYQWGDLEILSKTPPDAELPVVQPLDGWRWKLFASASERQFSSYDSSSGAIALGVTGLSLALVSLGLFATVNLRRQMRLAGQRVSFVNQVSHELRTPLTNIRMYADLLHDQLQRESSAFDEVATESSLIQRVDVIRDESERLGRLINNVLQFAHADKQPPLHLTDVDINEVVDEVLTTFEPQLISKGFRIERQPSNVMIARTDRAALKQILVNLIGNAEKYAADGKFLSVSTHQQEASIEICVDDRGPGVPAHLHERIFEPFFRAGNRLEDPAGTGIGLSIARQLARQLGGDCKLRKSTVGACFSVCINR